MRQRDRYRDREEHKQMFHAEEFQTIYAYTLPSWKACVTLHQLGVVCS